MALWIRWRRSRGGQAQTIRISKWYETGTKAMKPHSILGSIIKSLLLGCGDVS